MKSNRLKAKRRVKLLYTDFVPKELISDSKRGGIPWGLLVLCATYAPQSKYLY